MVYVCVSKQVSCELPCYNIYAHMWGRGWRDGKCTAAIHILPVLSCLHIITYPQERSEPSGTENMHAHYIICTFLRHDPHCSPCLETKEFHPSPIVKQFFSFQFFTKQFFSFREPKGEEMKGRNCVGYTKGVGNMRKTHPITESK